MSDFKAKMHQIRFRLGLYPRPREAYSASPDPLAGFKGLLPRGRGREVRVRKWRGGKGVEDGEGRDGEGGGRVAPPKLKLGARTIFLAPALVPVSEWISRRSCETL